MGAIIPKYRGTLKEKVIYHVIRVIIFISIVLIINLSPTSPNNAVAPKTLTITQSNN